MRGLLLVASLLLSAAGMAAAQQGDPAPYDGLIGRYVAACQQLSSAECEFEQPPSAADAARLACLFRQLNQRAGESTAAAHVEWAESYAATGEMPRAGFPSTIGQQQVLMAALIACRGGDTD